MSNNEQRDKLTPKFGEFSSSKLLLHPTQFKGAMDRDLSTPPISVEISLTSLCNVSCVWCIDRHWCESYPGILEKDAILRALEGYKELGVQGVVLEGGGEPTIYPHFGEVVQKIKDLGMSIGLITNGVAFPDFELVKYFDWIRVSLDAGTKEVYKEVKKADKFDDVMSNLKSFVEHKGENTIIGVGYLISQLTRENLGGVVQDIKDIGVDYVQIRQLTECGDWELPPSYYLGDIEAMQSDTFSVYAQQMEEYEDHNLGLPCSCHALSSVLCHDGKVFFCCRLHSIRLPDSTTLGYIGNIYDNTIKEIWDGDLRKKYAENMLKVENCENWCPSCRMTKYNVLVEEIKNKGKTSFI